MHEGCKDKWARVKTSLSKEPHTQVATVTPRGEMNPIDVPGGAMQAAAWTASVLCHHLNVSLCTCIKYDVTEWPNSLSTDKQ